LDAEDVSGAEDRPVVNEQSVIDRIADAHGHVQPPANAFTVRGYCARVLEKEGVVIRETNALSILRELMLAGKLQGRKIHLDGRQRWVFWE